MKRLSMKSIHETSFDQIFFSEIVDFSGVRVKIVVKGIKRRVFLRKLKTKLIPRKWYYFCENRKI